MGGQGPPYPVRFQSLLASRVPGGRSLPPRVMPFEFDGRLYRTQCTHVIRGALGSGASGSSTINARLLAPWGTPLQVSAGARSCPSQVCWVGISPFGWKSAEVKVSAMCYLPV